MPNLFSDLPENFPDELIDVLASGPGVRIEKIVSAGQASPPGFWYEQDQTEWVVVLKGEAKLLFEGEAEPTDLQPGDYVLIPAHCKHRVEWTSADELTVWLAVFFDETVK